MLLFFNISYVSCGYLYIVNYNLCFYHGYPIDISRRNMV